MTCKGCGNVLGPSDAACPVCFQPANQNPAVQGPPPVVRQHSPHQTPPFAPTPPPPRPTTRSIFAIRLSVIVSLGLLGLVFIFRMRSVVLSTVPAESDDSASPSQAEHGSPVPRSSVQKQHASPQNGAPLANGAPQQNGGTPQNNAMQQNNASSGQQSNAMPQQPPQIDVSRTVARVLQEAYATKNEPIIRQQAGNYVSATDILVGVSGEPGGNQPLTIYLRGNAQLFQNFPCVFSPGYTPDLSKLSIGSEVLIRGRVDFGSPGGPRLVDCDYVSDSQELSR